jgi:hypothetical protein
MSVRPKDRFVLRCRLFGHRPRFWSEGATMRWRCQRGCGAEGCKPYPTAVDAQRYAMALDREDRGDLGRRTPLGLLPLRVVRALARRRAARAAADSLRDGRPRP